MPYLTVHDLSNAWIFKHNSLPIEESDLTKIKPMTAERSAVLWDTFISRHSDHPDFFTSTDWPTKKETWQENINWEKRWDSDNEELPEEVLAHLQWDNNTVVYYCSSRQNVIETSWGIFKQYWKNFLFMDDGSILIGKKRQQAVQFLSTGQCKLGTKP